MKLSLTSELVSIQVELSESQIADLMKAAMEMAAAEPARNDEACAEDIVIEGFCAGQKSVVQKVPRKGNRQQASNPVVAGSGKKRQKGKQGNAARDWFGFLHLVCGTCGETKTFCAKDDMTYHRCAHGHRTELTGRSRYAFFTCECGRFWRYHTNARSEIITIPCAHCETPNDLMWNGKTNRYEKIN